MSDLPVQPRLTLDGLPLDVAMALSRLMYSAINFGCAPESDEEVCERAGARLQLRRDQLVAAIKRAIEGEQPVALPAGQHIELPRATTPDDVRLFLREHTELVAESQDHPGPLGFAPVLERTR